MNPYLKDLMAFADLLAACNVIDEDAVCFADEYDGGTTLGNIAEAYRRLNAENAKVDLPPKEGGDSTSDVIGG